MKTASEPKKISWREAARIHPYNFDKAYNLKIMTSKELQLFMMSLGWRTKHTGNTLVDSKN
jgi:hypothetical protein